MRSGSPSPRASYTARVRSKAKKMPPGLWLGLGLLLLFIAVTASLTKNNSQQFSPVMGRDRPLPVQTASVIAAPFDRYLEALGTVTAAQTVVVHSRVDGELLNIYFEEGQRVNAGDLLAQIDPRPYQVQLTQAEGQMARDKAQLEGAKSDLARYQTLLKQDSVSQQQVANQAALVAQYTGTVQYDQGQIDSARLNLAYTKITAPISGRIGLRRVDIGNMVRAADANGLAVITQDQPIDVMFTINEADVRAVSEAVYGGARFPVEAWDRSLTSKLAEGVMTTLDNQIDVATGTVKVKARFDNQNQQLFPNQFVNIRMKIGTNERALQVPSSAVQRGSQGTFAYVVESDAEGTRVKVRPISVGAEAGGRRVVTGGLRAGERVVTDGTDRLRDGIAVDDVSSPSAVAKTKGDAVTPGSPTVVQ